MMSPGGRKGGEQREEGYNSMNQHDCHNHEWGFTLMLQRSDQNASANMGQAMSRWCRREIVFKDRGFLVRKGPKIFTPTLSSRKNHEAGKDHFAVVQHIEEFFFAALFRHGPAIALVQKRLKTNKNLRPN